MRHRNSGAKLNRNAGQRNALMKGLANQFFINETLTTTASKAKWIQPVVERFIRHAQAGTLAARRHLGQYLPSATVDKLVMAIAPRFQDKQSGFTRIVALNRRRGDNSIVARLSMTHEAVAIEAKDTEKRTPAKKAS